MLTGIPLDLTPFGGLLAALGWLYWLAALAIVAIALWVPNAWWMKLLAAALAGGVVVYPVFIRPVTERVDAARKQQDEFKARLADAMALFERRCKTAGEKIHRTVDRVDGVVWMKWRPTETNLGDHFKLDDPYGRNCGGMDCIANLLQASSGAETNPEDAARHRCGYRYVETNDPADQKTYRYLGSIKLPAIWTEEAIAREKKLTGTVIDPSNHRFVAERKAIPKPSARYGIAGDDISTREDRERWIAGSSLKVIDLKTNEVIADRVGYLFDHGLGSTAGFRSPWPWARSYGPTCPPIADHNSGFLFRVLQQVKQEEWAAMANQVSTYLKYANLQMAAESLFGILPTDSPGTITAPSSMTLPSLGQGNTRASKFSTVAAEQFLADGWKVVEHKSNTVTGFSGTLFRNDGVSDPSRGLISGALVLSFRSTEFIDDAVRDTQATGDLEIKTGGFAIGQIADMENWFKVLNADPTMRQGKNFAVAGYSQRTKAPEASLLKTNTLLGRVASNGCRRPA